MSNDKYSNKKGFRQVVKDTAVFLLPPHESKFDRDIARDVAVNMLRESLEYLMRADQSDHAQEVLALAHKIECK